MTIHHRQFAAGTDLLAARQMLERETTKGETPPPPRKSRMKLPPPRPNRKQKPDDEREKERKATKKRPRPTGITAEVWKKLAPATREMMWAIADAARRHQTIRLRYRPKVQTAPGGPEYGKPEAVYRTVEPYSLRMRRIHTKGYQQPPEPTIVFFGYDKYDEDGETIKMFVADRVLSVEYKGKVFDPRWDVEWECVAAVVDNALSEITSSGAAGAYEVPLGVPPAGQRRHRKKKRKVRRG